MIKFTPNISIYDFEESKDIQNEVIWSLSKNLKGISSTRQRFNIHIVPNINDERRCLDGSIKTVWKFISIDQYLSLTLIEQKKTLLDLITNCLLDVSELLHWNKEAIIEASKKTLNENIQFEFKSKFYKNKKHDKKALIELKLDKNKVSIFIIFKFNNESDTITKHLIDTSIVQVSFFRNFDNPLWLNEECFGFKFKNGMTLYTAPYYNQPEWSPSQNTMDEWFKKSIDYNESMTSDEIVKLINK